MFCFCATLTLCCESFRTTLLQTSKAPSHPDMTSREAEGTPARVRPFLLTCACLPGPPWALSVSFSPRPNDSRLLPGERVRLEMSLLWEMGNEDTNSIPSCLYSSRGLVMHGEKDTRIIAIAGFFLMLHGSYSRAPVFLLGFHYQQALNETANPHTSSAVADLFKQKKSWSEMNANNNFAKAIIQSKLYKIPIWTLLTEY